MGRPAPDDGRRCIKFGAYGAGSRVAMTVGPGNKELVAKTLTHWKEDADPAGVREASALDKLPEAERKDWQALWAEVDGLLAKTR